MVRNKRPEAELFDGPARKDRAYLLLRSQAGILYSRAWPDRHKYFVFKENLLAGFKDFKKHQHAVLYLIPIDWRLSILQRRSSANSTSKSILGLW